MFNALNCGITGRAQTKQLVELSYWNPRDYSHSKHQRVDDKPYGGGPGMLLQVQPLRDAILEAKQTLTAAPVIYLSPQGEQLNQNLVAELAKLPQLLLIAGRYEGIDERIINQYVDREISIGDYVLSGGELAAMIVIDSITRLLPGALGDLSSAQQDSFVKGLLDYPHYTRPEEIDGQMIPQVLRSGDHAQIAKWRLQQALGRTYLRRPDLLKNYVLSDDEQQLLTEFLNKPI